MELTENENIQNYGKRCLYCTETLYYYMHMKLLEFHVNTM